MKTYHYCALSSPNSSCHYASGTFQFDGDINAPGNYMMLCEHVGKHMKPPRKGTDLVLLSLTVVADGPLPPPAELPNAV